MGANLTLNMEARLDEIERIHTAVEILAGAEGWGPDLVFQIKLVVEEIGTNIVKYGYDDEGDKDIRITLTSESDALTMANRRRRQAVRSVHRGGAARSRLASPGASDRRARRLSRA